MKMKHPLFKKTMSALLAVLIVALSLPFTGLIASAAEDTRLVDPSTIDDWTEFFGGQANTISTQNAGGVWLDKSVFKDLSAFGDVEGLTMDDPQNNFLVALSAIASNKSITGYSHVPTDTFLVLDVSGSMGPGNPPTYNDAVEELVTATNAAITELLALNNYNRVGVVLYSANATTILPLDRYTSTETTTYNGGTRDDTSDDKEISVFFETNNRENQISIVSGVKNGKGTNVRTTSRDVTGGTFIQTGIDQAMDEFLKVEDTVIEGTGMQSGTKRKPVIVLMTDGAPTYATTDYTDAEQRNLGNGSTATTENAFLTQLTAAYSKQAVADKYDNDVLFYTLGLGVNNNTVAEDVLDPQEYNPRAQSGLDSYWNSYFSGTGNIWIGGSTISRNSAITEENYLYVDEYFEAEKTSDLYNAFESIVNEIIIQSLYYPTLAESGNYDMDGYIEFLDDLGAFMEVKSVKGVVIGDTLFSGSLLAKNFQPGGGDLGTVENPNDMGDNMVWAVQQRLGLEDVQDARDLIQLAYDYGQLSYTSDTEFSNYIGWYGDDDGKFVSFWHEGHTEEDIAAAKTGGATHINKSYGMLGDVQDGHRRTDMMYASIQVHTNIETGHSAVIWKIPASLIPVVSYEISFEGENLDNAENIKVSVDDADPIRLLFEVGIRSDITPLNIIEKIENTPKSNANYIKNDDGTYTLFTNSFNLDELNDDDEIHPTQEINAIAWFEPSVENERYYYNENTPVYVYEDGEYVQYKGSAAPMSGTFYREYNIFEVTNKATGAAKLIKQHEEISAQALSQAEKNDDNTWYIPKGVIHRIYEGYATDKTENTTGTAPQSHIPDVEYTHEHYYFDVILGNNGSITVAPAQGIVISKEVDDTLANTNYTYTFTVTRTDIDNDNGEYLLTKFDANGNESGDSVEFTNSQATVTLMAGEKVYITGFPTGAKLKVSEAEGTNYKTQSVNGIIGATETADITIRENAVSEASFVNTLKSDGNLIITKSVEHPYGANYQIPNTIKFTFNVDLGDAYKGGQITTTNGTVTDDDGDGIFVVSLAANDNVTISNINTDTPVTVTEVNLPDGFAAENNEYEKSGTIEENQNTVLAFTNVYTPNKVNPVNLVVTGVKNLSGRDWLESDEFTFELQKYDGKDYVTIGSVDVTDETDGYAFDLTDIIADEDYENIGTYSYKIIETKGSTGGVTYDSASYYFDVHIVDPEMDSILEIGSVTASPTSIVSKSGNTWYVDVEFNNSYDAYGTKDVIINIEKTVETVGIDDYSEAGFTFGLYSGENLVLESQPTDQEGKTSIKLSFTEQALYDNSGATPVKLTENTFNLTLKEIVPTPAVKGMAYSQESYNITIRVYDDMQGGIGAEIYTTGTTPAGDTEYDASFTNTYTAKETSVTLEATKTLTGRGLVAGEFKFDLYNANSAFTKGTVAENDVTFVLDGKNGKITFNALTFDHEGDYYYVIVEDEVDGKGVTVDNTEHKVHINVADNGEGQLVATVYVDSKEVSGSTASAITFNNTYEAKEVDVTLEAIKTLTGRDLVAGEFKFDLYNADEAFNKGTVAEQDATFVLNGKVGQITFGTLTFDSVSDNYYVVVEDEVDGSGVTVDKREHKVYVKVRDNGEGQLVATVYVNGNEVNGSTASAITFNNTYEAKEVDVTLHATKTITGRDLKAGEFKFDLYNADESFNKGTIAQDDVTFTLDGKNGKITFNTLTFDSISDNYYVIVEDEIDEKGVTVDKTEHKVYIKVTDNGEGLLVATVYVNGDEVNGSTATAITFNNTYEAKEVDVTLEATKTLSGRDLKSGEFKFDLYNADESFNKGTVAQDDVTFVLDGKNGKITFNTLTFDTVSDNYYVVVEDEVDEKGVTVDKHEYKVYIKVSDNGEGELSAQIWVDDTLGGDIIFNNAYDADDAKYTISGGKELEGRDLVDGEFTFELYDKDGVLVDSKTNTDGKFTFKELVFTDIGEYIYTVKEKIGDDENVTYDTNVYTVTITVTDNGEGALEAAVTKLENTAEKTDDDIVFENTYTKPVEPPTPPVEPPTTPSVPQTGDNNNLALWLGLLFVSSSGFAGTVLYTRHKKTEN